MRVGNAAQAACAVWASLLGREEAVTTEFPWRASDLAAEDLCSESTSFFASHLERCYALHLEQGLFSEAAEHAALGTHPLFLDAHDDDDVCNSQAGARPELSRPVVPERLFSVSPSSFKHMTALEF